MTNTSPTKSAESNALLAQLDEDDDTVYEILVDMTETDLEELAKACDELSANARFVKRKKRGH